MNLDEVKEWFREFKVAIKMIKFLDRLDQIGLGHLSLDQPVQSLSSGEQQRLLLLNWLQDDPRNELFILDEPSIGLHYADIDLLYGMLEELSKENDVLVVEHNLYLLSRIGVGMVLE